MYKKWSEINSFLMQSAQMKTKMSSSIKNVCFLKYKIALQFLQKIIKLTWKHFFKKLGCFSFSCSMLHNFIEKRFSLFAGTHVRTKTGGKIARAGMSWRESRMEYNPLHIVVFSLAWVNI